MRTKNYDVQDIIEQLEQAQNLLREARDIIRDVIHQTHDRHAESYLLAPLEVLIDQDHRWLSRDFNIDRWIEDLQEEEDELEDEDEEEGPEV